MPWGEQHLLAVHHSCALSAGDLVALGRPQVRRIHLRPPGGVYNHSLSVEKHMLKVLDLFTGIAGISHALQGLVTVVGYLR